ncbi:HXXXD-type acyl-transferase family protein [Citrus sinensis]|uniref:stemmadenine O-acetyltransferase-like n=1 Tax=Citrus sinensis TaxID=2711 RepID=UPI0003D791AA|nr:stemmadenine O-acetyltransferase-like [Citrus sinensis]KAH9669447.1 HXXXD-type acyl-transferase family protein [Citrus sinensis]
MAVPLKNIFRITASKLITNNVQIFSKRSIKSATSDVQIISTERVQPSLPTRKHLRTYKLSLIDQMNYDLYIPLVFFYSASCKHQDFRKKSDLLKQSLATTLTHYYPFAGRFIDGFSVDCNDHGAAFIEANVGSDISKFLQPPDMELLQQLIPPSPQLSNLEISERELLAVQVNLFNSGEMAIGVCFSHGVADGSAIFNFMKTWGEIARGVITDNDNICNNNIVLDCTSLFPPVKFPQQYQIPSPQSSRKIVFKRLLFDGKKIATLKEKVNKELMADNNSDDDVLQATRFGIVSALIWGACIAVARERKRAIDNKLHSHSMYYAMNLRHKMNPAMFPRCMGNIFRLVRAEWSLAEDDAIEVTNLVREVIKAKRMGRDVMNNDEYLDFIKDLYEAWEDSRSFPLTSVVGLPYYEVDFGWGKPVWFSLGPILLPDIAILSSASDGEGIEALVVMFKEDMEKFEQETSIMAYASANPSIFIRK